MTYQEFKSKWLGKGINYDGAYGNQCMDVYRMYVKEVLGCPQSPPVQGAKDVWSTYLPEYFERIANSPTGVPQQGDIVIWGMNPYGHIAICDKAATSTLTCFEQNWKEGDGSGVTEIRLHGNYNNVLGWLRFKKLVSNLEDNMTEQEKIMLDFIRVNQMTEGQLREGYAYVKDGTVANLTKEIESLKQSLKDMADRVSILESENKANNDLIVSYQTEVSTAKGSISKLQADLKMMSDEKNVWKNRYEAKLQETADKLTVKQLLALVIKKLSKK